MKTAQCMAHWAVCVRGRANKRAGLLDMYNIDKRCTEYAIFSLFAVHTMYTYPSVAHRERPFFYYFVNCLPFKCDSFECFYLFFVVVVFSSFIHSFGYNFPPLHGHALSLSLCARRAFFSSITHTHTHMRH